MLSATRQPGLSSLTPQPTAASKPLIRSLAVLTLAVPLGALAQGGLEPGDSVLYFTPSPSQPAQLYFKYNANDELVPDKSDFKLIGYEPMSNVIGERWALVTISNTSSGSRFLQDAQIVATFANGQQSKAVNLNERFSGMEVRTMPIMFGQNDFPIVKIETKSP